ncbi:unnamed protein product [Albugo candida]|nr:unnamed protein product [Albugo candida]|eukprot:CCI10239.1 unnamed protein product [Albugo candida]
MSAQATFREIVKKEFEVLLQEGIERDVAVRQLLHRIVGSISQPSPQEVERVMAKFQMTRDDASRALIVKQEIAQLRKQGLDALEAILELTRKMQSRHDIKKVDPHTKNGCEVETQKKENLQSPMTLCQRIGSVSISTTQEKDKRWSEEATTTMYDNCHSAELLSKKRKMEERREESYFDGKEHCQNEMVNACNDIMGDSVAAKRQKVSSVLNLSSVDMDSIRIENSDALFTESDVNNDKARSSKSDELLQSVDVTSCTTAVKAKEKKRTSFVNRRSSSSEREEEKSCSVTIKSKQKRPHNMLSADYNTDNALYALKPVDEERSNLTDPYQVHPHDTHFHHTAHTYHHHSYLRHSKRHRK